MGALFVAGLLGAAWAGMAPATEASGPDAARPAAMDEADWHGLKAAMIGITGPYTQQGELLPVVKGRGDNIFGTSIAVSGNRAVVGAPGDYDRAGRAYVLERDASGRWRQVAQLRASDGANSDRFGQSVALSGDIIAVGAPYHDVLGRLDQGQAYVFVRDGSGDWGEEAKLTFGDANDHVGTSIALQGATLAVGAPYGNDDGMGGVVLYQRAGTSWSLQASLRPFAAPDPATGDGFGAAIALDGDRLLVGMPGDDTGAADRGSAYMFIQEAGTTWQPAKKFQPAEAVSGQFGHSVALHGALVAIGEPYASNSKGMVHTFRPDSFGGWLPGARLRAPDSPYDRHFGYSVALSGGTLAVGATRYDSGEGDNDDGAVFVYTTTGLGQWPAQATLTAPIPQPGDHLGWAVAIDGDTVLAGAPHADGPDFRDRGRLQVFTRSGATWTEHAPVFATSHDTQWHGYAVALSGSTAVVTAPGQPSPYSGAGVANVYVRGPAPGSWHWQAALPYSQDDCHYNVVAIEGDTLILGLSCEDFSGHAYQGAVHVYVRTGTEWNLQAVLIDLNGQTGDRFGASVALSGNSVVVGAPGANGRKGAGYVFQRTGTNWSLQQRLTASDGVALDGLGQSVAIAGDTLVLAAPYKSNATGAVYVSVRSGTTWPTLTRLVAPDRAVEDYFGLRVAVAGDTVMVGAPYKDGTFENQGAVYVFARAPGWPLRATLSSPAATLDGYFGYAVALTSHMAVVGERGADAVHMFSRRGTAWTHRGSVRDQDSGSYRDMGESVAISGTLVIAGAPYAEQGSGRAWIVAGDALFANGFQSE